MSLNVTHTYAILHISKAAFEEIQSKLILAGYQHAIHEGDREDGTVIDMHGLAVADEGFKPRTPRRAA